MSSKPDNFLSRVAICDFKSNLTEPVNGFSSLGRLPAGACLLSSRGGAPMAPAELALWSGILTLAPRSRH